MNTDPHGRPARGLDCYVRAVAAALGLPDVAADCSVGELATAYIALDRRSDDHRGHYLMLLWHEECGWAVAVETAPNDPAVLLAYVGDRVLPEPAAVADGVRAVLDGAAGRSGPATFRNAADADGLDDQLDDLLAAHSALDHRPLSRAG